MSADSEVVAQGEDNQEEQYRAEKRVKKRDCMYTRGHIGRKQNGGPHASKAHILC